MKNYKEKWEKIKLNLGDGTLKSSQELYLEYPFFKFIRGPFNHIGFLVMWNPFCSPIKYIMIPCSNMSIKELKPIFRWGVRYEFKKAGKTINGFLYPDKLKRKKKYFRIDKLKRKSEDWIDREIYQYASALDKWEHFYTFECTEAFRNSELVEINKKTYFRNTRRINRKIRQLKLLKDNK